MNQPTGRPGKGLPNGKSGGFSTVELIMVLMILAMLCVTVFTLIYSGQQTYTRINDNREASMNTRDALAYIDMRIRQNDYLGGATVKPCPTTGENALYIEDFANPGLATWIYFQNGRLLEYYNYLDIEPVPDDSTVIAELDSFDIWLNEDDNIIEKTVTYTSAQSGKTQTISSSVALRSVR